MTIGAKKAIIGTAVSIVALGFVLPLAFWLLVEVIDRGLNARPIMGRPAAQISAAASILIGIFWMSWSYSYLVFVGKGLPLEVFGRALHPTRYLVTTGPYAYSRNPMMLGMLFVLLGVALLQGSWAGILLVLVAAVSISLYLIEFEEKGLRRRFGDEYEDYRANVPLLIPRLTPYVHEPVGA